MSNIIYSITSSIKDDETRKLFRSLLNTSEDIENLWLKRNWTDNIKKLSSFITTFLRNVVPLYANFTSNPNMKLSSPKDTTGIIIGIYAVHRTTCKDLRTILRIPPKSKLFSKEDRDEFIKQKESAISSYQKIKNLLNIENLFKNVDMKEFERLEKICVSEHGALSYLYN